MRLDGSQMQVRLLLKKLKTMKSINNIDKIVELCSLGLDEHECNFLAAHFDELSNFFRKAVCIKARDYDPKRLVFMTPEGRAYEKKSAIVDCLICFSSIFLGVLVLATSVITSSCMSSMWFMSLNFCLVVLYGFLVWWLYHNTCKNLDKLSKLLCRKELEALHSEEHKKHLEEIQSGFTQKAVHKFVQHYYFDIYAKVFLSGWFYLSPRPEPVWAFFGIPEHAMQIVVRRRSSPSLTPSDWLL